MEVTEGWPETGDDDTDEDDVKDNKAPTKSITKRPSSPGQPQISPIGGHTVLHVVIVHVAAAVALQTVVGHLKDQEL